MVVDLVDSTLSPALENLTLPAITFEQIDASFGPNLDSNSTDLLDKTMNIEGNFQYYDNDYGFSLALDFEGQVPFTSQNGVTLDDNAVLKMLFNVRYWFENANITECIDTGALEIIDSHLNITDDCPGAIESIESAIKNSSYLIAE